MNQLATHPYPEPQPHAVLVVYTRHVNLAISGPLFHIGHGVYHKDDDLWADDKYHSEPPTKDPQNTYWVLIVPPQPLVESCK